MQIAKSRQASIVRVRSEIKSASKMQGGGTHNRLRLNLQKETENHQEHQNA